MGIPLCRIRDIVVRVSPANCCNIKVLSSDPGGGHLLYLNSEAGLLPPCTILLWGLEVLPAGR